MDLKRSRIDIFGVLVDDISLKEAVCEILRLGEAKQRGNYAVTVNSEFVMKARRDREFARILNNSDLAVADGWWVAFSRLISGGKAQGRVTGVELVENVCKEVSKKAITIGFLGGFGTVAAKVSKRQKLASPSLKVVYVGSGEGTISLNLRLKPPFSAQKRIDILFVAYGMGRQELWIEKWRKKLDVGVFIGVGGAFDYIAGVKKRAPRLVQNLGLEWLWRLVMEPYRIWRQRVLPIFFVMILAKILKVKIFGKI